MRQSLKDNEIAFSVRFSEIDMIKVVHHSKYWIWFEEGRFNFFNTVLNITTNDILSSNLFLPIIDCKCSYISSIKWNDEVKITTVMKLDNMTYMEFIHEVYVISDNHEKLASKAYIKHAFVDENFKIKLRTPLFIEKKILENVHKEYAFFSNSTIHSKCKKNI